MPFWYNDFYTTLYFVTQKNYKTLEMQAHALTRMRYFYSLNVIISHLTVQGKIELSLRMCYRFTVFPSLTSVFVTVNKAGWLLLCYNMEGNESYDHLSQANLKNHTA
jgi:hypothetical protein